MPPTDEDLARIGGELGTERLRLSAGCAGFATALADVLGLNGTEPQMPQLPSAFFVACGSVNPVTLRQMRWAEQNGFVHIHLEPVQKLEPAWLESEDCGIKIRIWLEQARNSGRCILDVNDPMGLDDTAVYAKTHGLTTEDLRVRISTQLAHLMKRAAGWWAGRRHPLHRRRYATGPDADGGYRRADACAGTHYGCGADQLCLSGKNLLHYLKIRRIWRT